VTAHDVNISVITGRLVVDCKFEPFAAGNIGMRMRVNVDNGQGSSVFSIEYRGAKATAAMARQLTRGTKIEAHGWLRAEPVGTGAGTRYINSIQAHDIAVIAAGDSRQGGLLP
jgi:hypothetical protein